MLLAQALNRVVRSSALILIDHKGNSFACGNGEARTAPIVRFAKQSTERKVLLDPELALGEAYMRGEIIVERGSLRDVLAAIFRDMPTRQNPALWRLLEMSRRLSRTVYQLNKPRTARKNVAHHYDLTPELYKKMLGHTLHYSCAYFDDDDANLIESNTGSNWYFQQEPSDLDAAQDRKARHIERKLQIRPGMNILDIGCGWGSLALHLAKSQDVRVTGITLSQEQHQICVERARQAGLQDRVTFELRDYRDIATTYDRIVSVGMFEHVGVPFYSKFFDIVFNSLTTNGVALVHTIGRIGSPGWTSPWIRKYIFPGGYIPALSEIIGASERSGLLITDVEVLRLHYAFTLRSWYLNFMNTREQVVRDFGAMFSRMWEFYLVASEMSFVYGRSTVFQLQFCKDRFTLPITRAYQYC